MCRAHLISVLALACHAYVTEARQARPPIPTLQMVAKQSQEAAKPASAKPAAKAAKAADAPKAQDNQRLQKLQQMQYDRRPSTILRVWATPPKAKDDRKTADKSGAKASSEDAAVSKAAGNPESAVVSSKSATRTVIRRTMPNLPAAMRAGLPPSAIAQMQREMGAALGSEPVSSGDPEIDKLSRSVTLGEWSEVKKFFGAASKEEAEAGYAQLLNSLTNAPMNPNATGPRNPQFMEKNYFAPDDIVGLAAAAKGGLQKEQLPPLGQIIRQAVDNGVAIDSIVARFQVECQLPKDKSAFGARLAARALMYAALPIEAGGFLPTAEKAKADKDREALNLLAQHFLARQEQQKKVEWLEKAWDVTQAILSFGDGDKEEKDLALRRAVDLAPKIAEQLGQSWLDASFSSEPQRGMDILATVGGVVSQGFEQNPMSADHRAKELLLQKTAIDALLKAAPTRAHSWSNTLTVLAQAWMREAAYSHQHDTSTSMGPRMNRDIYGNFFYMNEERPNPMYYRQQNQPQPIATAAVLEARPTEAWLAHVEASLLPRIAALHAQLFLKVGEEAKAFPFIERLGKTHGQLAKDLVEEFLRVWTKNHDPNESRRRTNQYFYFYSYETRAESIPLTRSKQERNLVELADWVKRLKALNVGEIDENLLATAFTNSHSSAEVYRMDAIEKVFGPLGGLKPKTLAGMAQKMRGNLAGVWREAKTQNDKKTNRKQKDIQAEVVRGYALANAVLDGALKRYPEDWSLQLAKAATMHDEINYRQELEKSAQFSAGRQLAFAEFAKAARLYAAGARNLSEDEQKTDVYDVWFYAALGACEIPQITEERVPDAKQPGLIRAAMDQLPREVADKHKAKFANALFSRMSGLNPAVKYRYLKHGFEIVGDRKEANEARQVFDYYKDLVTELKLQTAIDGSNAVGHAEPFGVFVQLLHTREIERESGGFGKYLQNQNNMYWSYNYGRPTANYRDKFQAAATEALKEHFEVLSVTFQNENVHSKAGREYGWRVTPYAYLLLKSRGPQVDKLPPLRLDLDFLDTSGYVVLPIETAALPIDAKSKLAGERTIEKLRVAQTLDERQAEQGKLVLEIKATAQGLLPPLDRLVELRLGDFEVVKSDDQGVSVAKFETDADKTAIVSERTWMVTMQAKPGLKQPPTAFHYAAAKVPADEMLYQRYADADLAKAEATISLEQRYGKPSRRGLWTSVLCAAVVLVLAGIAFRSMLRPRPTPTSAFRMPAEITPFSVLGLLRDIETNNGLAAQQKAELAQSIAAIERRYFADDMTSNVDLRQLAESWLGKATH